MGPRLMVRLPGRASAGAGLAASECPEMGLGSFGNTHPQQLRGPGGAWNWLRSVKRGAAGGGCGMGGIGFVRRSCPRAGDWLEVADLRETSSCRRRRNWVRLVKRVGVRKGRIGFVSPNKGPASGRVADLHLAAMRPKAWLFPIQRPRVGVLVGRSGCIKDSLGPQGSRVREGSYWLQSSRRLAQGIPGK